MAKVKLISVLEYSYPYNCKSCDNLMFTLDPESQVKNIHAPILKTEGKWAPSKACAIWSLY